MQQLRSTTKSLTFPSLSIIARYSFIQLSQLGHQYRERKCPIFETVAKSDSNPCSLDCESGILLPLSYRPPQLDAIIMYHHYFRWIHFEKRCIACSSASHGTAPFTIIFFCVFLRVWLIANDVTETTSQQSNLLGGVNLAIPLLLPYFLLQMMMVKTSLPPCRRCVQCQPITKHRGCSRQQSEHAWKCRPYIATLFFVCNLLTLKLCMSFYTDSADTNDTICTADTI